MPADYDECVVSAYFARQLERELAAAIKQRDEARENLRDACEEIAMRVNSHSMLSTNQTAEYIAVERGWDCFNQITETGITETDINEANINNQSFRERKLD